MQDVSGYADLCRHIEGLSLPVLVAIDGLMKSGKSPLANALASKFSGVAIHTDEFVVGTDESLPYLKRMDFPRIEEALTSALVRSPLVAIEGICLLDILANVGAKPSVFAYIKRIDSNGTWHDGFHLEDSENDPRSRERCPARRSQFEYHRVRRPHESAGFVLLRLETEDEA